MGAFLLNNPTGYMQILPLTRLNARFNTLRNVGTNAGVYLNQVFHKILNL